MPNPPKRIPAEEKDIQEMLDLAKKLRHNIPELNSVPEEKIAKELVQSTSRVSIYQQHTGPLPSPEDFARYEQILPGLANRIVLMSEKSLDSTIESRKTILTTEKKRVLRGQLFAFFLTILFLISSLGTIIAGLSPFLSGSLGLVALAPIIASFLQTRRVKKE